MFTVLLLLATICSIKELNKISSEHTAQVKFCKFMLKQISRVCYCLDCYECAMYSCYGYHIKYCGEALWLLWLQVQASVCYWDQGNHDPQP